MACKLSQVEITRNKTELSLVNCFQLSYTCISSPPFVCNVAQSVQIFLGCLQRIIVVSDMNSLLREVKEKWLASIVLTDHFVRFACEKVGAVCTRFVEHHLRKTTVRVQVSFFKAVTSGKSQVKGTEKDQLIAHI